MSNEHGTAEALSNVDSAWLRMEEPTNLMTITGLIISDEKFEYRRLKSEIEDRLLPFDRFRQRVVESRFPFAKPRWEEDQHFALAAPTSGDWRYRTRPTRARSRRWSPS